jgi:hypothetical protein
MPLRPDPLLKAFDKLLNTIVMPHVHEQIAFWGFGDGSILDIAPAVPLSTERLAAWVRILDLYNLGMEDLRDEESILQGGSEVCRLSQILLEKVLRAIGDQDMEMAGQIKRKACVENWSGGSENMVKAVVDWYAEIQGPEDRGV